MFGPTFSPSYLSRRLFFIAFVLSTVGGCTLNTTTDISTNEHQSNEAPVSKIVKVDDLALAIQQADALPLSSTLVVFDIDDTLLTATEFFGSDKWYDWQRGRALSPNGQSLAIDEVDKVNCLFDVLGMTYEIATNRPTQENMAALVQQVGNDTVILTARSSAYRAATKRELARNGLSFSDKALTAADIGYHYDFTHSGRTAQISYVDGVLMVQGMDKGVLLLDLLDRAERNYDAVVFVDDKTHNINNMANALQQAGIDFYGFHYTKVDKTVSAQEVQHAQAAASDLTKLLSTHFVERTNQITAGACAY